MASISQALEKTLSHYEKKEYAEAEKGADAMLASYPDFNRALFLKAVILEETGRKEEASPYLLKAGPLFPLWMRLALQLQDIDPARALVYFEKAARMDPENNLVLFSMGSLYEKLGRAQDARKCFGAIDVRQEIITKVLGPLGFLAVMIAGIVMLLERSNYVLLSLVLISAVVCLLWLRRDGSRALAMMKKKRTSQ